VEHGLERARADGHSVWLETGTAGNVPYYERFGFRVVDDPFAPGGGPQIWFMRWDPDREENLAQADLREE
jgi:predicted N-acetyltransferase YhbS